MMSRDAKSALSKTIRVLRGRLLGDLHDAVQSRYRMGVGRVADANLVPHVAADRTRLEEWLAEQQRAEVESEGKRTSEDFRAELETEAAYTWLHRLVVARLMEEAGLIKPALLTKGRESSAYREFREWSPELLGDETEGYQTLLQLVFDELALDLPGLFGPGLIDLVPMPPATLRAMVDALNDSALDSCWSDDTTLGWVYQYWNDPAREELDAKLNSGGKVEPHEVASKTQLFTERYMVEWLLQNSLGTMWLATCKKNGWTPEVEAHGILDDLEARRTDWRAKREAGEVELDDLMPIRSELEDRWKYWVPQPIPDDAVKTAPDSIADLKLLDPACGSGHFLVIAFDYLYALYEEEARQRKVSAPPPLRPSATQTPPSPPTPPAIVASILSNNLHGIDIDARCIQIAAAALYLKARAKAPTFRPSTLNLVAPDLPLARLPEDDPALLEFRRAVSEETGIDIAFVEKLLDALKEAYHLGSLLKVEDILGEAMRDYDARALDSERGSMTAVSARDVLLDKLEQFLTRHTGRDDLGLHLHGEQLAAGIRFVRMIAEGSYDVVVANPPYSGTSNLAVSDYVKKQYKRGKADLYAAFLERGLQLVRKGGVSAMVTMRGWMFIKTYEDLRTHLLKTYDLGTLNDIDRGGFEDILDEVVAVSLPAFWRIPVQPRSVAMQPTATDDNTRDRERTARKRASVLAQVGRYEFSMDALKGIEGQPLIYWWDDEFLREYLTAPKLSDVAPAKFGANTGDNTRFLRRPWEVDHRTLDAVGLQDGRTAWVPYIKGAAGKVWCEPLDDVLSWRRAGLELKQRIVHHYDDKSIGWKLANSDYYFVRGVAFAMIGAQFSARRHMYPSVFDGMASSIFPQDAANAVCLLNSPPARMVMESLNPTVHFQVGDVDRLPMWHLSNAASIDALLQDEFFRHEGQRETSFEFSQPGPSRWAEAQAWAQRALESANSLPPSSWSEDGSDTQAWTSFSVGVALGRFGHDGEGWLGDVPPDALPHGILFLSESDATDSLDHPASEFLKQAWAENGAEITTRHDLGTWLRERWFVDVHKNMYENRPIYFPLSSQNKNFVAHVSIHRWTPDTLRHLLADHLIPEKTYLEGLRDDLAAAKAGGGSGARDAEDRYAKVTAWLDELDQFIADVEQCAEKGPPPTDANPKKCPPREVVARYAPDLDDGVMINSAALWPLLAPQWKDPKKWWTQLATEKGFRGKHFDWSHLAMRYWPTRVDAKCQEDPSLAVAHGCFWKYHPERAYEWELRLQHEIEPDFTIDEDGSDDHRATFLAERAERAGEIRTAEAKRREKVEAKKAATAQGELV